MCFPEISSSARSRHNVFLYIPTEKLFPTSSRRMQHVSLSSWCDDMVALALACASNLLLRPQRFGEACQSESVSPSTQFITIYIPRSGCATTRTDGCVSGPIHLVSRQRFLD